MLRLSGRRSKGFRAERELVEILSKAGLWSIRIPVSAVRTILPDIIVFHKKRVYGFEVKSTAKATAVYYRNDFDNLLEWYYKMVIEEFEAEPFLAVRFRGGVWRFYPVTNDTEKVKCDKNSGLSVAQLVKKLKEK